MQINYDFFQNCIWMAWNLGRIFHDWDIRGLPVDELRYEFSLKCKNSDRILTVYVIQQNVSCTSAFFVDIISYDIGKNSTQTHELKYTGSTVFAALEKLAK